MHWSGILVAGLAAAIGTFFTDWFFFGVWLHDRYGTYAEVWRPGDVGGGNRSAIVATTIINICTCFGLVMLLAWLGLLGWLPAIAFAIGVWLLLVLPMLVINALFMRIDPLLLLPNGLGHLTRLLLCGIATAWLVP